MNSDLTYQNKFHLLKRLFIYQNERFSILTHIPLISSFTFSAISYSRICRNTEGFISLNNYLIGVFATITLFFLLRIFDEFKDKEDDEKYRKYLPVPRGLISLKELKIIGFLIAIIQICVIAFYQPRMLFLYFVVIFYLLLMGVEFFVPKWLRAHHMTYIYSHMFIIPLVDIYSTGLDWLLENAKAPTGLLFFFAVSYMNGIVLEFGRKIRTPNNEEDGVISYTFLFGTKKGTFYWILVMFVTLLLSIAASVFAGYGILAYIVLTVLFVFCSLPGLMFIRNHTQKLSKSIEYASGIWTLGMYLSLGGIPMLNKLIFG